MIFDTQITLRLLSYPIVSGQTAEKLERETTGSDVFDVVRSYGQETEEIELTCKRRDGA